MCSGDPLATRQKVVLSNQTYKIVEIIYVSMSYMKTQNEKSEVYYKNLNKYNNLHRYESRKNDDSSWDEIYKVQRNR